MSNFNGRCILHTNYGFTSYLLPLFCGCSKFIYTKKYTILSTLSWVHISYLCMFLCNHNARIPVQSPLTVSLFILRNTRVRATHTLYAAVFSFSSASTFFSATMIFIAILRINSLQPLYFLVFAVRIRTPMNVHVPVHMYNTLECRVASGC